MGINSGWTISEGRDMSLSTASYLAAFVAYKLQHSCTANERMESSHRKKKFKTY